MSTVKVIACIEDQAVIEKILAHLQGKDTSVPAKGSKAMAVAAEPEQDVSTAIAEAVKALQDSAALHRDTQRQVGRQVEHNDGNLEERHACIVNGVESLRREFEPPAVNPVGPVVREGKKQKPPE